MKTSRLLALGIVCAAATLFLGCGSPDAVSYYQNEEIMDDERSLNYQLTYNTNSNQMVFDEDSFTARFSVFPDKAYNFEFTLINKTDRPVVIDWNLINYIDLDGRPHSIITDNVQYGDPVTAQRPTRVQPQGTVSTLLRPADREERDGAMRLLPARHSGRPVVDSDDQLLMIMPIKVLGQVRNYRFSLPLGQVESDIPWDPAW
ncbi:hypothetical protein [Dethiosulfatarculus sandiegensis]|nr:hypothetical protein [Dethiosulfatarculus sandiegensis]